jgi:hypothetical protein
VVKAEKPGMSFDKPGFFAFNFSSTFEIVATCLVQPTQQRVSMTSANATQKDKSPTTFVVGLYHFWCPEEDSNLHAVKR